MKAMIFAAGKGTRLGSITESMPKALVDINGKTALRLAVENCTKHGFGSIIINVHHFPGMVEEEIETLRNEGFDLAVSDEREELLETGGGLFKARHFFDREPFLVYNVDIVTNFDLSALYHFHLGKKGLATLAVRSRTGNRFFLVDRNGIVCGWKNATTGEEMIITRKSNLAEAGFTGIHVVDPEIFRYMEEGIYSMTTLYLRLARKHQICTYKDDSGFWGDIGTPESLENARLISKLPE
ncbi:MAG TPA: nucleotidyltransferase family protein [Bacteroidales bacterium]|jgi:NDP-sugar pyrophosphorylase family protein|nr:nucleotidyltransferase family protein [Bacteroidales bacterium]